MARLARLKKWTKLIRPNKAEQSWWDSGKDNKVGGGIKNGKDAQASPGARDESADTYCERILFNFLLQD